MGTTEVKIEKTNYETFREIKEDIKMPIGIIIMAVLGLSAFIASKFCGVQIDPIGKLKKFQNDIRDRWHWLDKTLNRIPKFRRKPPETCRSRTLYLDWAEEDGSHEPYYQPVGRRGTSPISVDTISIQTTISNASSNDDFVTDFTRPMPATQPRPRARPQTLLIKSKDYLTTDTITPVTPLDSSFTGFAGNSLTNTPANTPINGQRSSGTDTPVMFHQKPIYINSALEIKGTDFRRF